MEVLGRLVVRRRVAALVLFVALLAVAGAASPAVFGRLQAGGYDDETSDSTAAARLLRDRFGVADPVAVLAVETPHGVDEDAAAATSLVRDVERVPGVTRTVSWWTSGRPAGLRGTDGRTGEVIVYTDRTGAARTDLAGVLADRFDGPAAAAAGGPSGGLVVRAGGTPVVSVAVNRSITRDLGRAEAVAVPVTVVLLVVVFGSLVAAGLPFLVAAGSIVGTFFVLFLITFTADASVFALNLVTGLGLGLGIDYALLVVSRFREELAVDPDVGAAVVRTVATAGRTVLVSGVTVAVTLGSLTVFPEYFLRSFGYVGMAAPLLAVGSALVALPAVLALLGHRVNRFRVLRGDLAPRDRGAWASVARRVMRSPWPVIVVVAGALLVIASPARHAAFGQVDERVLPRTAPAVVASDVLRDRFPAREATPVQVVVPGGATADLTGYAARLSRVPGVVRVVTPAGVVAAGAVVPGASPGAGGPPLVAGPDARLSLVADVTPQSGAGEDLVRRLRAVPAPPGTLLGGDAAQYADSREGVFGHLPLVLGWIGLTTLVVLFLFTGSVVLPVKAVVLNVLSLGATLGALVWVFQEGHLRGLLGDFTLTGSVDTSMIVLIAVVAFALSMDYEVFLLARIKEEHDRGLPTPEAVALGLQRSGRIITAAAALLAVVFVSFASSEVTNIKQLGVGVAFAIVVDATAVRGLLVPALMRVMDRANWWAPGPLRALHRRIGLHEGPGPAGD